jgi:AI-2 transport protein TqsA
MKRAYNSDPVIKFFVSAIGLFVICFILKELQHIFIPFIIAYIVFFFFEPLNNFLEQKKIPLFLIILIDLVLTVSLVYGISRIIIDSFVQFGEQLPAFTKKLNHIVSTTAVSLGIKEKVLTRFNLEKIIKTVDYGVLASGVFTSTVSIAASILLTLFFFIFISSGHNKIFEAIRMRYVEKGVRSSIKKMKKEFKTEEEVKEEIRRTRDEALETLTIQREMKLRKTFKDITLQIQRYIVTKFFISLTIGILFGVICASFGIEFFIIWAMFALLLNFIPNIGSIFAVIFPSLMALIQYESFGYALIVACVLIILQNIVGNLIEPKIFGDRLGLNPLVILVSLLVWGYLWGIVGMFLSVPLTAVIKIIVSNSSSKNMRFLANLMGN